MRWRIWFTDTCRQRWVLRTNLFNILDMFEVLGSNEAIPRKLIAPYYTLEVARDTNMPDQELYLLIVIPIHTGHKVHDVLRATLTPQLIRQTERTTQYHLSKTHFCPEIKTNLAEVIEQELSTPCWGSHCLRRSK